VKDYIVITYILRCAIFNAKRCTRCKLYFIISKRDDREEKISLYNLQTICFSNNVRYYTLLCHLYFKWCNKNFFIPTNFN